MEPTKFAHQTWNWLAGTGWKPSHSSPIYHPFINHLSPIYHPNITHLYSLSFIMSPWMQFPSVRAGAATPAPGGEETQGSRWVPYMHQSSRATVDLAHEWRFKNHQ